MRRRPTCRFISSVASLIRAEEKKKPRCLVMTVGSSEDFRSQVLESGIARKLFDHGYQIISLIGNESEIAHDLLDDTIDDMSVEDVITTFHANEAIDEVAACVYVMCKANDVAEISVVINEGSTLERELRDELSKQRELDE